MHADQRAARVHDIRRNAPYNGRVLFDTLPELTVEYWGALLFDRTDRPASRRTGDGLHDFDDCTPVPGPTDALVFDQVAGQGGGARVCEVVA
ncbi:hypothetical protein [Streptomyces sp. NBC_00038]|uniref:hypothetical protein n=1 Tax=Streptomyces sp. NBC_00038 TaxID=2903615 RepID=UPI00225C00E2|nr:hypothetical protein [Streptomyces sp. NBC_00038]MCX5556006.1 hypothetical protein [Streptomyces sp. NBC_00038]